MTKIIGLTGGIGSGKTTIARYFQELGVPVYIADEEGKKITNTPEVLESIKTVFGNEVFDQGQLNRAKISQIVFDNPQKLQKLNTIIHPAVAENFKKWVLNHHNFPYVVKEAAILFESGSYKDCDLIISVVAPLELRIERVMKRDLISRELVLKRINNQWSEEKRKEYSQYIIENIELFKAKCQVDEILKKVINQ